MKISEKILFFLFSIIFCANTWAENPLSLISKKQYDEVVEMAHVMSEINDDQWAQKLKFPRDVKKFLLRNKMGASIPAAVGANKNFNKTINRNWPQLVTRYRTSMASISQLIRKNPELLLFEPIYRFMFKYPFVWPFLLNDIGINITTMFILDETLLSTQTVAITYYVLKQNFKAWSNGYYQNQSDKGLKELWDIPGFGGFKSLFSGDIYFHEFGEGESKIVFPIRHTEIYSHLFSSEELIYAYPTSRDLERILDRPKFTQRLTRLELPLDMYQEVLLKEIYKDEVKLEQLLALTNKEVTKGTEIAQLMSESYLLRQRAMAINAAYESMGLQQMYARLESKWDSENKAALQRSALSSEKKIFNLNKFLDTVSWKKVKKFSGKWFGKDVLKLRFVIFQELSKRMNHEISELEKSEANALRDIKNNKTLNLMELKSAMLIFEHNSNKIIRLSKAASEVLKEIQPGDSEALRELNLELHQEISNQFDDCSIIFKKLK